MRARSSTALGVWLALSAGLLLGCGGDGDVVTETPAVTVSLAETLVGAQLLPPDGVVAAATVLAADDLPPDGANLGADDLSPAS